MTPDGSSHGAISAPHPCPPLDFTTQAVAGQKRLLVRVGEGFGLHIDARTPGETTFALQTLHVEPTQKTR